MIKNRPAASVFDKVGPWVFNSVGDPLADPEAYEQGKSLWLEQVKLHAEDSLTLQHAVQYLEIDTPEEAERLALGLIKKDRGSLTLLGEIYGFSVLGVTARDYATGNAKMASADRAQSDFAKRALATLEASVEPDLTRAAAKVIKEQGDKLRGSGNLSWDYQSFPKRLLERSSEQPQRIRVGGNVQVGNLVKLVKKVTPQYPPEAKAARIEGTVKFTVIVNIDGHIKDAQVVSGHPALIPAAKEAVRQWVFRPTLLNGKPVEVETEIDINFNLSN
jgi:TonB family protein